MLVHSRYVRLLKRISNFLAEIAIYKVQRTAQSHCKASQAAATSAIAGGLLRAL